jgi:hypothetical protein
MRLWLTADMNIPAVLDYNQDAAWLDNEHEFSKASRETRMSVARRIQLSGRKTRHATANLERCLRAYEGTGLVLPPQAAWGIVQLQSFATVEDQGRIPHLVRGVRLGLRGSGRRSARVTFFTLWYPELPTPGNRVIQLTQSRDKLFVFDDLAIRRHAHSLASSMGISGLDQDQPNVAHSEIALELAGQRLMGQLATLPEDQFFRLSFEINSIGVSLAALGVADPVHVAESLVPIDDRRIVELLSSAR